MHLKQGGLNKEILGGLTLLLDKEANELCCVASPFKLIKATRSLRKAHADSVSSLHAGALVCEGCLREVYAKPTPVPGASWQESGETFLKNLDKGFSTFSMVRTYLNPPPYIKGAFFSPPQRS